MTFAQVIVSLTLTVLAFVSVVKAANPVIARDFPDPAVLLVDGVYHAYATQTGNMERSRKPINIQHATSTNLKNWTMTGDVLPQLGSWAQTGQTWAPYVFYNGNEYVMQYSGWHKDGRMCVSFATSSSPNGPFVDSQPNPNIFDAIDPYMFVEDGSRYIVFARGGGLFVDKLSDDRLTVKGEPTQLIRFDQNWEGAVNEAPTLIKKNRKYVLFYSANACCPSDKYSTGFAKSDNIKGPYVKSRTPLMDTDVFRGTVLGPGGEDVIRGADGKQDYIVFHGWNLGYTQRQLFVSKLTWDSNDNPVVGESL